MAGGPPRALLHIITVCCRGAPAPPPCQSESHVAVCRLHVAVAGSQLEFARTHKNPYTTCIWLDDLPLYVTSSYWTHALCKPLPLHFKLYLCHNFSIILIVLANIYYTPFLTSLYTSFVLNCSLPLFFPFCQNTICLFLWWWVYSPFNYLADGWSTMLTV